jgi:hypothetical protein
MKGWVKVLTRFFGSVAELVDASCGCVLRMQVNDTSYRFESCNFHGLVILEIPKVVLGIWVKNPMQNGTSPLIGIFQKLKS